MVVNHLDCHIAPYGASVAAKEILLTNVFDSSLDDGIHTIGHLLVGAVHLDIWLNTALDVILVYIEQYISREIENPAIRQVVCHRHTATTTCDTSNLGYILCVLQRTLQ